MNPTELRIGNYVHTTKSVKGLFMPDGVAEVLSLGVFEVQWLAPDLVPAQTEIWNKAQYPELEPIPITSDWLDRFGFRQHTNAIPRPNWKLKDGFCLFISDDGRYKFRETFQTNMGRIQYVHQLQNLYFALTGKELQLTSEK